MASRFALAAGYAECTRPGGKAQAARVHFCVLLFPYGQRPKGFVHFV